MTHSFPLTFPKIHCILSPAIRVIPSFYALSLATFPYLGETVKFGMAPSERPNRRQRLGRGCQNKILSSAELTRYPQIELELN
jgi:hypothetical protein